MNKQKKLGFEHKFGVFYLLTYAMLIYGFISSEFMGFFLLIAFGFPLVLICMVVCLYGTMVTVLNLINKNKVNRWESILTAVLLLLVAIQFLPIKPYNYVVCRYNPNLCLSAYKCDIDGWRGGEYLLLEKDGKIEIRSAYRQHNGKIRKTGTYTLKTNTIYSDLGNFIIDSKEGLIRGTKSKYDVFEIETNKIR